MNKLKVHWILLRPFATLGLIPPFLLGLFLAGGTNHLLLPAMAFIGSTFILYASHYHNSYSDYIRGVDTIETTAVKGYTLASTILPQGLISETEVKLVAAILYLLGCVCWLFVICNTSILSMIPFTLGMLCAIAYNEIGKYRGWGEILMALSFGLSITLAGYIPIANTLTWETLIVALIPGMLWGLFYTMDQYQDSQNDMKCGIVNLAIKFIEYHFPISRYLEFGFFTVLILHIYLILIGILPAQTFISIAATPIAFLAILSADTNPKKSGMLLLFAYGLYVLLMDLGFLI